MEKHKKLLSHHFIYKQQQNFLKNKKETLSDNECIIILDFAENYTFMVQDAIQSFHWNNTQATICHLLQTGWNSETQELRMHQ